MNFLQFCNYVYSQVDRLEGKVVQNRRFSQREFKELLETAKKSNLEFMQDLIAIKNLSFFDVGFLLSSVDLTKKKIETIKASLKLYDEKAFCAQGQTFSDFIFRVCANLDVINSNNLDIFKELAACKNDIYDFSNAIKKPAKFIKQNSKVPKFQFVTVFYN